MSATIITGLRTRYREHRAGPLQAASSLLQGLDLSPLTINGAPVEHLRNLPGK